MSVKTDVVNLRINVGGDKAQNELNELRKKAADLKFEMEGVNKRTKEYAAKKAELAAINTQMGELKKTIGLASLSQRELNKELKTLTSLRSSVVPFSEEYKKLDGRIKQVKDRLYEVNNGVRGFSATWSKVKDEVKQFGMLAAGYLGFQFITQSFGNMIVGAGKLSDSLADLQRVTGLTAKEAKAFNEELKLLDTRTATQGLREIAIVAGKLGVAKEDLLGFTQAVDMLVVALGDELGNADAITSTLGKILQVFDGRIDGDNITRLGNAIVELANTGSSTGAFISDFDQRLSGIAKSANIGLGALSGLGAGLEELGGRVESSATAIQKVIISIAADIPKAAQIAGVELSKFQQMFANTPQEALLQYARGLVQNKQSFSEITNAFKDAGEEGARVIETLSKLGQNTDFLRSRMELGSKALQENGAITEAFNLKNQTLGATIDKLSKEFNKLIASDGVQKFLKGLVNLAFSLIEGLKNLGGWISRNTATLTLWTAALIINTGAWGKMISFLTPALTWIKNLTVATNAATIAQKASAIATTAWGLVIAIFTGNMAKLRQEFALLKVLMGTNPLGIFLIAVGAAILVVKGLSSALSNVSQVEKNRQEIFKEANKEIAQNIASLQQLTAIVKDNAISLEYRKDALKRLIDLNPEYLGGLTLENIATKEGEEILKKYNQQLINKARLQAAEAKLGELAKKDLDLALEIQEKVAKLPTAFRGLSGPVPGRGINASFDNDNRRSTLQGEIRNLEKDRLELKKQQDDILKLSTEFNQKIDALKPGSTTGTTSNDSGSTTTTVNTPITKTVAAIKEEIKKIDELIENTAVGSKKLKELLAKKTALEKLIDFNSKSSKSGTNPKPKKEKGIDINDRLYVNALTQKPIQFPKVVITPENLEQVKEQYSALVDAANKALQQTQAGQLAALELNVRLTRGKEQLEAKKRLLLEETALELKNTELTEEQKELIRQRYRDGVIELEIEAFQNQINKISNTVADVGNATLTLLQNFYAFKNAQDNADLAREKKINDAKQKLYKKQLDNKLISQAQFDKKVAEAQEQFDAKDRKVRRKQAEREQRVAIYQAVITGIMSVLRTMSSVAFPFNIPLAAAQAAAAGFQVAAIKKEPLPELGKGALLRRGPKHNSKSRGMPIVNPETGQVEALVERGEAVVSSRAMDDKTVYEVRGTTSQITSALNGRAGGRTWQGGASVRPISSAPGWMSSPGPSIKTNMPAIMADGGVFNPTASINIEAMLEEQRMSRMEIAALRTEMANWQTQLRAVVSIKEFREVEKQYDQARTQSGL
jgi:TP901 family phage tail tape measure protein